MAGVEISTLWIHPLCPELYVFIFFGYTYTFGGDSKYSGISTGTPDFASKTVMRVNGVNRVGWPPISLNTPILPSSITRKLLGLSPSEHLK
jgi:hypothetical protein